MESMVLLMMRTAAMVVIVVGARRFDGDRADYEEERDRSRDFTESDQNLFLHGDSRSPEANPEKPMVTVRS